MIIPLVLLGYSISDTALVTGDVKPDHYDIERIKTIFKRHDPRHLKQGQTGYLNLSEQDINTILMTSLTVVKNARAKTRLHNDEVDIDLSFKLPENRYGHYANISLLLKQAPQHLLVIDRANFGTLSIPGWLLQPIWEIAQTYLDQFEEYRRFSNAIKAVQISNKQLILAYKADWKALEHFKQRGQELLLTDSERYRIRLYHEHLAHIISDLTRQQKKTLHRERKNSLSTILQPMFQFALSRSKDLPNQSAIDENKAILVVLALYATGKNIDTVLGQNETKPPAFPRNRPQITLRHREDLMQHFIISAFLVSAADDALAHATGLFKEISDSKGGSGFSFADLAADRAGVEFGKLAVASESSARYLQTQIAKLSNESDYMPDIHNLPEGLQQSTFQREYGSPEDKRYMKMQNELDRRIHLCRLYQQLPRLKEL